MQNKLNQFDTWMMWMELYPKDSWPVKTFIESISYFTQKYGHHPIKAVFPNGTDLLILKPVARGIDIDASPYVLPKHIHLALDPNRTAELV
jgi:hypothetical protein